MPLAFGAGPLTLVANLGQSNTNTHALASQLSGPNAFYAQRYPAVRYATKQSANTDTPLVWQEYGFDTPRAVGASPYNGGAGIASHIGFSPSMMRDLDGNAPNRWVSLVLAVGGAGSFYWAPGSGYPTSPPGGPNLFTQAVTTILAAKAQFGCTEVVLTWDNGGTDALTLPTATGYFSFLTTFVTALRAALGNIGPGGGPVPFVYGLLPAEVIGRDYVAELRQSQIDFEPTMASLTLISEDSITIASGEYDGLHFNADGYMSLGHLYAPAVGAYCNVVVP